MNKTIPRHNADRALEDRRIGFGKYEGRKFKNVPTDYLIWFYHNAFHQMKNRKQWAKEELISRGINL